MEYISVFVIVLIYQAYNKKYTSLSKITGVLVLMIRDFVYCNLEEKEHFAVQDIVVLKYFYDTKTVLLKHNEK